jgi:ferredoxin
VVTEVIPERRWYPVRVTVDQDRCIASGQCVIAAKEVFDQRDEDGVVVLRTANPPAELAEDVREAVALCPARAIVVDESDASGARS